MVFFFELFEFCVCRGGFVVRELDCGLDDLLVLLALSVAQVVGPEDLVFRLCLVQSERGGDLVE